MDRMMLGSGYADFLNTLHLVNEMNPDEPVATLTDSDDDDAPTPPRYEGNAGAAKMTPLCW